MLASLQADIYDSTDHSNKVDFKESSMVLSTGLTNVFNDQLGISCPTFFQCLTYK